ncbi:GNAT family N-acetyltransferase [Streptomyces sp. NPDC050564]|uniref:GNAT family N-acetyltransferase n=1 Tax=Streptomyces sp. NPDC050564 TaxID=3365631 RepID=UPI0037AE34F7
MGPGDHEGWVYVRHRGLRRSAGRPGGAVAEGSSTGPCVAGLLGKSARGQGAAVAAVDAVVGWALRDLRIPRLELWVEPGNTASVRTAERAAFQREELLRGWQQVGDERRDMFMYSLLNDEL